LQAAIRLYLDENLSPKIAEQLRTRGVDAVCVGDLGMLGKDDAAHLARATAEGRVLVTADEDFLRLAAAGVEHAGIVFGALETHSVGDWVKTLELICLVLEPGEMVNHVEFV
jgi:predicted nuclease of predicted toxin-antitoxin system